MIENSANEYAVEVPGRGYIGWAGSLLKDLPESGLPTLEDAEKTMKQGKAKYESMGCPDIAKTLRIVERTITVTRSDWTVAKVDANA